MKFKMNRRRFITTSSTALALSAMPGLLRQSYAASNEVRVTVHSGDAAKATIEAIVKPFEAETGIKVTPITQDFEPAQLELMVQSNNVTVDVVGLGGASAISFAQKQLLEPIDYSIYKKDELDGILPGARQPHAVGQFVYGYVMVLNTKKLPADKPRPATWADFWDTEKYPASRLLVAGQWGEEGAWEEALMADGVPIDQIYPMDIDRVFRSLDKIKPHIRKWWASGSDVQQMMRSGVGDLVQSYDGRAQILIDQGVPLEINRNQSKIAWDYWAIPKGSPNVEAAQKFIEFAMRADRQAAFSQLISFGPTNLNAFKTIPENVAVKLASNPKYLESTLKINKEWYAEIGTDGKTNTTRLQERWNEWILQ